jgi:hypothetical protein
VGVQDEFESAARRKILGARNLGFWASAYERFGSGGSVGDHGGEHPRRRF